MMKYALQSMVALVLGLMMGGAVGATEPNKPVRLVVAFPPGGTADMLARLIQVPLQQQLGNTVVVENRAGAQGVIGASAVARADADGSTYVVVADSYGTSPGILESMPFDAKHDLTGVAMLATSPVLISTAKNSPIDNFEAMLQQGRQDGDLLYGTYGTGSLAHLAMAALAKEAGISATHIPYKGGGPLMIAALADEVPVALGTYALTAAHLSSGGLRPLVVLGKERFSSLPDVPASGERQLVAEPVHGWFALLAPARTDMAILDRMHEAVQQALSAPNVRKAFARTGLNNPATDRKDMDAFLHEEIDRWSNVARQTGIKAGG